MAVTIPALIMPAQVTPTVIVPTIKPTVKATEAVVFTNTPTPTNTPEPTQQPTNNNFLEMMRTEFNNGCMGEGASYAFCNCAFNYMVNKYGVDKLIDLALYDSAQLESAAVDGALECMHLY